MSEDGKENYNEQYRKESQKDNPNQTILFGAKKQFEDLSKQLELIKENKTSVDNAELMERYKTTRRGGGMNGMIDQILGNIKNWEENEKRNNELPSPVKYDQLLSLVEVAVDNRDKETIANIKNLEGQITLPPNIKDKIKFINKVFYHHWEKSEHQLKAKPMRSLANAQLTHCRPNYKHKVAH